MAKLNKYPGILTWIFSDFRVMIPENLQISRYCYRKSNFVPKTQFFLFLSSCTTFKTDYVYKNHLRLISTYMPWLMIGSKKKMGSSKDNFLDFRVLLPGSKIFLWISPRNQKYFRILLKVLLIHAKNQTSKISCNSPFNHYRWLISRKFTALFEMQ